MLDKSLRGDISPEEKALIEAITKTVSSEFYTAIVYSDCRKTSYLLGNGDAIQKKVWDILFGENGTTTINVEYIRSISVTLASEIVKAIGIDFSQDDIKARMQEAGFGNLSQEYEKILYFPSFFEYVVREIVKSELIKINNDPDEYSLSAIVGQAPGDPGKVFIDEESETFNFPDRDSQSYGEIIRRRTILDFITDESASDEAGDDMKIDIIFEAIRREFYEKFGKSEFDIYSLEHLDIQGFNSDEITLLLSNFRNQNTIRV